jgi:hypothetical protein
MTITNVDPRMLHAHEHINLIRFIQILIRTIVYPEINDPILIDKQTNTILDGHHRTAAAKLLRRKSIPARSVDYLHDHSVIVTSRRKNIPITKQDVIHAAMYKKLFPQKTTRHQLLSHD